MNNDVYTELDIVVEQVQGNNKIWSIFHNVKLTKAEKESSVDINYVW